MRILGNHNKEENNLGVRNLAESWLDLGIVNKTLDWNWNWSTNESRGRP